MSAPQKGSPVPPSGNRTDRSSFTREPNSAKSGSTAIDFAAINRAALSTIGSVLVRLLPGGRVVLPTVDGASVVYAAVAFPVWRFHREALLTRLRARLNGAGDGATSTPSERIKRAVDEALVVLADIERRAAVHLEPESQIAAE
jgi:hypothetical protein